MSRLTSAQWGTLAELVTLRDLRQQWTRLFPGDPWEKMLRRSPCVVWLDPNGWGICSGRITMNHVKPWPAMSYPREKLNGERFLVAVCWRHHLETTAGRNWATSHLDVLRMYLKEIYEPEAQDSGRAAVPGDR